MKPANFPDRKRQRQATALGNLIQRGEPEGNVKLYYHELSTLDTLQPQASRREQRSKINRSSTSFGKVR